MVYTTEYVRSQSNTLQRNQEDKAAELVVQGSADLHQRSDVVVNSSARDSILSDAN
jgi:hypothetical protein